MTEKAIPTKKELSPNYLKIGVLSIAHMFNDFYGNYLPQMLPFLAITMTGFNATKATILTAAFTITSSLVQPLFGLWLDRHAKRWLVYVGTLWMAIMFSVTGLVDNYVVLVVLAALAGMGTAVFHPQASTMVNVLSGDHKGVLMSVFVTAGNLGFAISPLLLIPLFENFGLQATPVTVIPGVLVAFFLFLFAPRNELLKGNPARLSTVMKSLKDVKGELLAIVGVIAIRTMAYTAILTLLPLYFQSENLDTTVAGHLVAIMLACGAIGGLIGGFLSDRFGRKPLIVGSLLLATPLFLGFLFTQGVLSVVLLALGGTALLSSFSVTVVAAQEAIPGSKALAAGISLGFANGIGGLGAIAMGGIADAQGLPVAMTVIFVLPIIAGFLGLFMKNKPSDAALRG